MKRLALAISIAAALVLPATALAAGGIAGKYTTKIAGGSYKGTWTLNLAKAGTYTVAANGTVVVHGQYTATVSKITFSHERGPAACLSVGKFSWKRTGKALKLTKISDTPSACAGRSAVLAHVLTLAA